MLEGETMGKLPKALIKKYGISKKAWQVYRNRKGKKRKKASNPKKKRKVRKVAKKKKGGRKRGFGGFNIKNLGWKVVNVVAGVAGTEIMTSSTVTGGDGVISQGLALMRGETDIQTAGQTLLQNYQGQGFMENIKKIAVGSFVSASPQIIKKLVGKVMRFLR